MNNQLDKLICPESTCKQTVSDEEIRKLFIKEPELLEKLEKWRTRREDYANRLLRHCTKPNCEGTMIAAHDKVEYVQCPLCGTKSCFSCRDAYHKGITCE